MINALRVNTIREVWKSLKSLEELEVEDFEQQFFG
jgi:hypothetical protein